MTLSELRAELIRTIRYASDYDPNTPASDYNRLINRAYLRVCHRLDEVYTRRVAAVVENQSSLRVAGLRVAHRVWWVEPSSLRELYRVVEPVDAGWLVTSGEVRYYEQVGDELWLYPRAGSAGQVLVEGRFEPEPLVSDSDEPVVGALAQEALLKLSYALWLERYPERVQERVLLEREAEGILAAAMAERCASRWVEPVYRAVPVELWRLGR